MASEYRRLVALLGCEIRARNDVLMDTNCPIYFAATAKQAAKRKVSLNRLVIDPNHAQEMLQRLVGLLVQQKIEAFQIVDVQRWWRVFFVALTKSPDDPAGRRRAAGTDPQVLGLFQSASLSGRLRRLLTSLSVARSERRRMRRSLMSFKCKESNAQDAKQPTQRKCRP